MRSQDQVAQPWVCLEETVYQWHYLGEARLSPEFYQQHSVRKIAVLTAEMLQPLHEAAVRGPQDVGQVAQLPAASMPASSELATPSG